MTLPVVLEADGLDALADPSPPSAFRALLREALDRGRDVLVPAVVRARRGGGLVITSDPENIARLAVAVPAARVITRPTR
jgi:hypothetical protein